ncbi:MAG: sulfotransferase family 2 domain-containing protein [Bacteroidales bacterium]|nr:sulfotransferase family 2 domain-containing protein [Bacteroidales bacterium]
MFRKNRKIKNHIELISIHIPKTAGTSFRNILKKSFGEEKVARLDIKNDPLQVEVDSLPFTDSKLPPKIRVIHGHFKYPDLEQLFEIKPGTPVVTWLRDPVQRVVSNYFYLSKRLHEELDEKGKGLNILAKMEKSLMEYARAEINRNRISKFLTGIKLDQLDFVGIMEHYAEDLEIFKRTFDLPDLEIFEHNVTGTKKEVCEADLEEIKQLNTEDISLYEIALKIRDKQLQKFNL